MEPADLVWRDGVPESARFGDVYFSRDNGLEETRYVFIGRNLLRERFTALAANRHFVVAETGFGTGLNFLAAWAEWLDCRPKDDSAILHFVSVERFPLTRSDLEKALSFWPELASQAAELIAHYDRTNDTEKQSADQHERHAAHRYLTDARPHLLSLLAALFLIAYHPSERGHQHHAEDEGAGDA